MERTRTITSLTDGGRMWRVYRKTVEVTYWSQESAERAALMLAENNPGDSYEIVEVVSVATTTKGT